MGWTPPVSSEYTSFKLRKIGAHIGRLSGTLVSIIQNDYVSFSFLQITYLGITQAVCSITSTFGFWYIQNYFRIRTKRMFLVTNFFSVLIPLWGMLGLWTTRIGYHHRASSLNRVRGTMLTWIIVGVLFLQRHFRTIPSPLLCCASEPKSAPLIFFW